MQTRLQRQRDKQSLKQAGKYVFLTIIGLILIIKFGLPALIRLATFIGNLGSSNQPIETTQTLPPAQPVLSALPEATNSGSISVSGYTGAGVMVRLFRDGLDLDNTVTDDNGEFEFKAVVLKPGENNLYALAENDKGAKSDSSRSFTVYFDDEQPELTVDSPQSGERFFDSDSPITLTGKTEADSQLTVNAKFIHLNSEGNFSTSWPLSPGDNQLDFVVTDRAGNSISKIITVNYTP